MERDLVSNDCYSHIYSEKFKLSLLIKIIIIIYLIRLFSQTLLLLEGEANHYCFHVESE